MNFCSLSESLTLQPRYHRIPAHFNSFSVFLHRRVFITIYRAWGPSKSGAAHQSANGAARRRGTALAGGGGGMGVPRLISGGGAGAAGAGGAAATAAATRELLQQLTKTQLRAPGEIDDDDEDLVEGDVSINHSTAAQQLRSLNSELGISLQVRKLYAISLRRFVFWIIIFFRATPPPRSSSATLTRSP